jgi:hypothetical protein
MTLLPEKITVWVKREFNAKYHERVINDLIDVATGTREGNAFEVAVLAVILK